MLLEPDAGPGSARLKLDIVAARACADSMFVRGWSSSWVTFAGYQSQRVAIVHFAASGELLSCQTIAGLGGCWKPEKGAAQHGPFDFNGCREPWRLSSGRLVTSVQGQHTEQTIVEKRQLRNVFQFDSRNNAAVMGR